MSHNSTYANFVESLAAMLGLLGVVLCLQASVASVPDQELVGVTSGEKICCIQSAGHNHDHTESSALVKQLTGVVSSSQVQLKAGGGSFAAFQKASSLVVLKAYALEIRQQCANHSFSPPITGRHILFRRIRT